MRILSKICKLAPKWLQGSVMGKKVVPEDEFPNPIVVFGCFLESKRGHFSAQNCPKSNVKFDVVFEVTSGSILGRSGGSKWSNKYEKHQSLSLGKNLA